ncbi:hypothetical protein [Phytohabitans houttuyneae]|uniref:hypothetical protein n=1 Tax=Phytohabitans houttuyneae TaxID=1076126 RepID=UPI001563A9B8|nr:hypothetical protein [Phytohabitans houttuyneae]
MDDEFTLWLLLGLEFLLRAPLARVHPSLLASPEGESVLHAVGIVRSDARPKSITTKTVLDRLKYVVPDFGQDRVSDALYLANLRNEELHTANAALKEVSEEHWMPRLISVVEVLCQFLELQAEDVLNSDIVAQARALRIEVDRALERDVQQAISRSRYFFGNLTAEERQKRRASAIFAVQHGYRQKAVECPACGSIADLDMTPGRTTKSKFVPEENSFVHVVVYVAKSLECQVCGLQLTDTAQVTAAGLPKLYQEARSEDRYAGWQEYVDEGEINEAGFYASADE